MYHIKHDKRAESSVELICAAVLELLETKPLGEITISDVQRRSTVSRSTFYRNFDSLEDVLALLCDRGFDEIAAGSGAPVYIRVFHYAAVLEALVRTGRADILAESLKKLLLRSKELPGMDEARLDYFAANTGYVMTGILATWLRRGRRESEEELADILADCFRRGRDGDAWMISIPTQISNRRSRPSR